MACGQTGKLAAKRLSGYFGRPTDLSSACFPGGFAFALSLPSFHSCHHRLLAQLAYMRGCRPAWVYAAHDAFEVSAQGSSCALDWRWRRDLGEEPIEQRLAW